MSDVNTPVRNFPANWPRTSGIRAKPSRPRASISPSTLALVLIAFWPLPLILLTDSILPFTARLLGWMLWALCFFPTWQYLVDPPGNRRPIPFMPVIGLLFAWYYARPLAFGSYNEHWRIRLDPTTDYDFAAQLALEGWIVLLIGWRLTSRRVIRPLRDLVATAPQHIQRLEIFLACLGPVAYIADQWPDLPIVLGGFARLFHSLGYLGMGLLTMNVASRRTSVGTKAWLAGVTAIVLTLQLASGFVSGLLTTVAVLFLAYWAVRRRASAAAVVSVVLVVVLALTIKGSAEEFRRYAWTLNSRMTNSEKASLFFDVAVRRIADQGLDGALSGGWRSSAKRSANMDLLADVVRRTPDPIPYWHGRSYVSLVGLAIPRFLWPNKPTKNLGQEFGHRYSVLDASDTHTSFNLPFLVEFYANFGEVGVVLGMLLVGLIYGLLTRLTNNPGQSAPLTMVGIVIMLPLLNIESDFSLTFGGLVLDGFALWLVLRKLRGPDLRKKKSTAFVRPSGQAPLQRLA